MSLPRTTPSAVSVDAQGLLDFLDAAERDDVNLHSLMVAREGQVIAEGWWAPYAADRVHLLYSCSKSFTATAIGLLVDEGRIGLQDRLLDHLPLATLDTAAEDIDPRWWQVQVQHALSMTVGHDQDAWMDGTRGAFVDGRAAEVDWIDLILRAVPDHEPGTVFTYNQVATYLLARAVTQVTGESLLDFLRPRLLEPLGISHLVTHTDTAGNALGFTGIHAQTDALLALSQLYLNEGEWDGRRLLSAEWVRTAREPFGPPNRDPNASPDWAQGYGFSFWNARHGYRGDGAYGQYAIVLPDQRITVAITSEIDIMQRQLDALWTHLLPAVDRPSSPDADQALTARLAGLGYPAVRGIEEGPSSADATRGEIGPSGLAAQYAAARVERAGADHFRLTLDRSGEPVTITVGDGEWAESLMQASGASMPVVASGGWQLAHEGPCFRAEVRVIETPHSFTVQIEDGRVDLDWRFVPLQGPDPLYLAHR